MMKIRVQNPSVRHNIELFKRLLEKIESATTTPPYSAAQGVKIYHAFVHRITGDIAFAELVDDKKQFEDKSWKPIILAVSMNDPETHLPNFEIREEGKNDTVFHYEDLHPGACRILAETLRTLNIISKQFRPGGTLDLLCKNIIQLHIEALSFSIPGKDIIHEAWHQLDRVEAEKLLMQHPVGTFFFRKGEFIPTLEKELQPHYQEEVRCFTLTYCESIEKIVDLTIVKKAERWFIYDNDPSLPEPSYPSIQALLESQKSCLRIPLLH